MNAVRIALCQIVCLDGDRRGNFARIERAVADAKAEGAELACLPEMAIYGWVNPQAHERAHPIPGVDSQRLSELAQRYKIWLCIGLAEKDGERLYDAAVLISDTGEILLKHRKINLLRELMTPAYAAGRDIDVVDTKFGRIGVLICADTHENDLLDRMAKVGPDLVLVPYGYAAEEEAWPKHGLELERVVTHAAQAIGAPVFGTNLIGQISHGPWKGRTYAGRSVAADKTGHILALAGDFDREIKVVTLP